MDDNKPVIESRSRWDGSGYVVDTRILYADGRVETLAFTVGPDVDPQKAGHDAAMEHIAASQGKANGDAETGSGGDDDTGNDAEGNAGNGDGDDESGDGDDGSGDGDDGSDDADGDDENDDSDDDSDGEGGDSQNDDESQEADKSQDKESKDPSAEDPPEIFWQFLAIKWGMIHQPEIVNRNYK